MHNLEGYNIQGTQQVSLRTLRQESDGSPNSNVIHSTYQSFSKNQNHLAETLKGKLKNALNSLSDTLPHLMYCKVSHISLLFFSPLLIFPSPLFKQVTLYCSLLLDAVTAQLEVETLLDVTIFFFLIRIRCDNL